jgi:inner membrane protein YidH
MPNQKSDRISVDDSDPRVRLACERTLLAYERTQIAWVRTALTLISFGFAISEFFTYLRAQQGERATVLSPRAIGLSMVVIALIALTLATWHHQRAVKLLRRRWPDLPAPITRFPRQFPTGIRVICYAGALCFAARLVLLRAKTSPQDSNCRYEKNDVKAAEPARRTLDGCPAMREGPPGGGPSLIVLRGGSQKFPLPVTTSCW